MGAVITPAASLDADRVRGLDGLRAIAAFAIVFHHVGFRSGVTTGGDGGPSTWGYYLGRLDIGVPVFFALSGFLLFRPIVVSILDDRPLRPALVHLWRRALRIYPAFWVALFLIVALTSEEFKDVVGTITNALLIQIHWPTHAIGPIPQAWSLATEVSFYAVLPLMARFLRPWLKGRERDVRRNGLFVFIALCYLLSVFFRIWVLTLDTRWTPAQVLWLPGTLDYFAIGMALAVAWVAFRNGPIRERLDRLAGPAGLWWIAAAITFHIVSQHLGLAVGTATASWPREMARQLLYGLIGLFLLFPLIFGGDRRSLVRSFARTRTMEWLGLISYSIYLWHMVFVVHSWEPLADLLGAQRESLFWDYNGTNFWVFMVMALVPTLVVSVISYYAIERTFQRMQSWLHRPTLDPSGGERRVQVVRDRWVAASFRAQLGVIAAVGFVGRVLYVIFAKHDQTLESLDIFPGDQFFYTRAADALAEGEGFVTPWHDIAIRVGLAEPGSAAAHAADHPPLTAIVAAPASFLPGGRGDHLFEQRFIMCAVGTAVIVMVGLLAREVAGRAVGVTAAVIAALYPGLWINDGVVMAESLTVLMITGALWATARYRRALTARLAAELGVWLALAGLARAESLLLCLVIVVPLFLSTHWDEIERAITSLVVTAAAVILVIAPWAGANLVRFEEPVYMSHGEGLVLVGSYNDAVFSGGGLGSWNAPFEYIDAVGRFDDTDPSVDSAAAVDEALTYAGDHVRELPKVMIARVGRLWSVFRPLETAQLNTQEGRETWASHLAIAGLYVLAPLAAIGWWRVRDGWSRWMLGVMVFHVTLLGALFYGTPRFRAPAETVIVVMAAIGIHWLASLGACRQPRTSSSPPS
jgi:peptidoglycan/LPS O-acetylase OafA/YrhL/4-amino-4-deoxy-L-arabinose transferase-like glycosyltransferase